MPNELQVGQWYYYRWGFADVYQGQLMAYDEETAAVAAGTTRFRN